MPAAITPFTVPERDATTWCRCHHDPDSICFENASYDPEEDEEEVGLPDPGCAVWCKKQICDHPEW